MTTKERTMNCTGATPSELEQLRKNEVLSGFRHKCFQKPDLGTVLPVEILSIEEDDTIVVGNSKDYVPSGSFKKGMQPGIGGGQTTVTQIPDEVVMAEGKTHCLNQKEWEQLAEFYGVNNTTSLRVEDCDFVLRDALKQGKF
jgi:hypothetical protein